MPIPTPPHFVGSHFTDYFTFEGHFEMFVLMNRRSFSKGLQIYIKTLNFGLLYTKSHVSLEECYITCLAKVETEVST